MNICINILKNNDKYISLNNGMLIVVNQIVKPHNASEIKLVVQQYLKLAPFFFKPINSIIIDYYIVNTKYYRTVRKCLY